MVKHLSRIGNSLGLVIERPILRMVGITAKTPLRVSHDGKRILIEPVRNPLPPADVKAEPTVAMPDPYEELAAIDVEQNVRELEGMWGMSDEHARELTDMGLLRCMSWASTYGFGPPSEEKRQTAQRLEACLDELRADKPWPEAIAAALVSFPR
jgi:antitoxin MazE